MFGKTKDKKKIHVVKYVVLQDGLLNFKSESVIEVVIDEPNNCITFKDLQKDGPSATLSFDKIVRYETGTKIGIIPKLASKNQAQVLQTLKIVYSSNDLEKEINLCETNFNGTAPFNLLKVLLNKHLQSDAPKHIDL